MTTGVVVVLFHPDKRHVVELIDLTHRRGQPLTLVDNSPSKLDTPLPANTAYLHLPANEGIATAQNRGIAELLARGCDKVILFDQDSQITPALLDGLSDGYDEAVKTFGSVAAVGPQIVCEFHHKAVEPKIQKALAISNDMADVQQIIASGMVLTADSFNRVGPKEEALFIDGVDHEWCWRARNKGFHIIKLLSVSMNHRQGEGRIKALGFTFKVGAPVRLYYQVRNVLVLSRRAYVPRYWKLRNLCGLPIRWLVNRWRFPEGKQRGQFFVKGLIDGWKGRMGKIPD
ncbi:glycosyltransferase family 2 protein [Alteromonas sp. C1M14]|uniref:glycosyltransferase family 2 protein n=1 Tax=Alteromonas sp. C1M14 TaxID=2841567 RepID=UPI001C097204|nr:glycosyltransferase family 2 protein [Alteromonas sp. C1M14]MBU2977834.1 glycosyltransferase family 2 protein [Alteromonas sp. C1M14]